MGFFDGFLGGIKNIGKSVVGAVKTVGKKIGDAGQAVLDFSRNNSIGTTLQDIGGAATLAGVGLAATGIGAPFAAVAEGVGGLAFLGGTGLRAAEIASNKKISGEEKVIRGATDVALPLALPSVLRGAGKVVGAGGRLGIRAADKLSRTGVDAVTSAGKTVIKRAPAASKGYEKAATIFSKATGQKIPTSLKPYAYQAAKGAVIGATAAGYGLKVPALAASKVARGFEKGTGLLRTTPERMVAANALRKMPKDKVTSAVKDIVTSRAGRTKIGLGIAGSVATGITLDQVRKNLEKPSPQM